jgi:hypothetical protein
MMQKVPASSPRNSNPPTTPRSKASESASEATENFAVIDQRERSEREEHTVDVEEREGAEPDGKREGADDERTVDVGQLSTISTLSGEQDDSYATDAEKKVDTPETMNSQQKALPPKTQDKQFMQHNPLAIVSTQLADFSTLYSALERELEEVKVKSIAASVEAGHRREKCERELKDARGKNKEYERELSDVHGKNKNLIGQGAELQTIIQATTAKAEQQQEIYELQLSDARSENIKYEHELSDVHGKNKNLIGQGAALQTIVQATTAKAEQQQEIYELQLSDARSENIKYEHELADAQFGGSSGRITDQYQGSRED